MYILCFLFVFCKKNIDYSKRRIKKTCFVEMNTFLVLASPQKHRQKQEITKPHRARTTTKPRSRRIFENLRGFFRMLFFRARCGASDCENVDSCQVTMATKGYVMLLGNFAYKNREIGLWKRSTGKWDFFTGLEQGTRNTVKRYNKYTNKLPTLRKQWIKSHALKTL